MAKPPAKPEKGNRPVYVARAKQSADGDFMVNIGAAWKFNDGDGLVVKLHSTPFDWKGDFILVAPKADE